MATFTKTFGGLALACLSLTLSAPAALAEGLESHFSYTIVESDGEGNETLVERTTVKPGEVINYQISHDNKTDESLEGLVIAIPVPAGVTVTLGAEQSSLPAVFEVQAEIDPELEGLEWATLPAVRKVAQADGTMREEPLPEDAILAVRWTLAEPLDAGETAINSYRVQVN